MPATTVIQTRAGTAAAWTSANPVLALGERGIETDTLKEKSGDGSTAWSSLAYLTALLAPLASPALTGTPTAPTAAINTNTTQIATTAFAVAQAASGTAVQTNKTLDTAGTGNTVKINGVGITDVTGTGKVVLDTLPTLPSGLYLNGTSDAWVKKDSLQFGDASYGIWSSVCNYNSGMGISFGAYHGVEITNSATYYPRTTVCRLGITSTTVDSFFCGRVFFRGDSSPTAGVHIAAGTATAGTAPLKFTSGINLTTAEAGALEWNGTNLFISQTSGPTRKTLAFVGDTITHIIGNSATPGIAAGAGAGTSPTVSVAGTDLAGAVSITTGTLPTGTNAVVATITFATAYGAAPYVVLQPSNALTATLTGVSMVFVTSTTTTFVITSGTTALTAATAYKWNFMVCG